MTDAEPVPYVLVSDHAYGIELPNGSLYRELEAHLADPQSTQPTVWMTEDVAEISRDLVATRLEVWYGIPRTGPTELRVVLLERGADGIWRRPDADPFHAGYRPLDLDTEELSEWPCLSGAVLSVAEAHRVMRQHKECAGLMTCRVRGRARAVLARAGVMVLNTKPSAWEGLHLPDAVASAVGWGW